MQKDLISIVIPCFNTAKFLPDCFASLDNQTYQKFEVFFVNDGSTDNTLDVLKQYCQNKPNCKIVNQPNSGVSTARNAGLACANGEFVYFYDSDDVLLPNMLEELLHNLKQFDADVSVCGFKYVAENFKPKFKPCKVFGKVHTFKQEDAICQLFSGRLLRTSIWNKLFKHNIIKKMNGYPNVFSAQIKYGEDTEFNFKYLEHSNKTVFCGAKLYCYRQRQGSIVHSKFNENMLTNFFGISSIIKSCEGKFPKAQKYAQSWQGLASIATLFYIFKSDNSDKNVILQLQNQLKRNMPNIVFGAKNALLFRIFAPLGYIVFKVALCARTKNSPTKTKLRSAQNLTN